MINFNSFNSDLFSSNFIYFSSIIKTSKEKCVFMLQTEIIEYFYLCWFLFNQKSNMDWLRHIYYLIVASNKIHVFRINCKRPNCYVHCLYSLCLNLFCSYWKEPIHPGFYSIEYHLLNFSYCTCMHICVFVAYIISICVRLVYYVVIKHLNPKSHFIRVIKIGKLLLWQSQYSIPVAWLIVNTLFSSYELLKYCLFYTFIANRASKSETLKPFYRV